MLTPPMLAEGVFSGALAGRIIRRLDNDLARWLSGAHRRLIEPNRHIGIDFYIRFFRRVAGFSGAASLVFSGAAGAGNSCAKAPCVTAKGAAANVTAVVTTVMKRNLENKLTTSTNKNSSVVWRK